MKESGLLIDAESKHSPLVRRWRRRLNDIGLDMEILDRVLRGYQASFDLARPWRLWIIALYGILAGSATGSWWAIAVARPEFHEHVGTSGLVSIVAQGVLVAAVVWLLAYVAVRPWLRSRIKKASEAVPHHSRVAFADDLLNLVAAALAKESQSRLEWKSEVKRDLAKEKKELRDLQFKVLAASLADVSTAELERKLALRFKGKSVAPMDEGLAFFTTGQHPCVRCGTQVRLDAIRVLQVQEALTSYGESEEFLHQPSVPPREVRSWISDDEPAVVAYLGRPRPEPMCDEPRADDAIRYFILCQPCETLGRQAGVVMDLGPWNS